MKFLAWVMFLTSTVCFVTVFCKQQWDTQLADSVDTLAQPTDAWRIAMANSMQAEADELARSEQPNSPTTQPAVASSTDAAPIAPQSAVAAGDVGDAVR